MTNIEIRKTMEAVEKFGFATRSVNKGELVLNVIAKRHGYKAKEVGYDIVADKKVIMITK